MSLFSKIIFCLTILMSVASLKSNAQAFNGDRSALMGFLTRMYKNAPYDIRIVNDYDDHYLVSAVSLDPSRYRGNESTMLRVASVKAASQAARYFNGSNITAELVISTVRNEEGTPDVEILERIWENSAGYVNRLENMGNFSVDNGWRVFIYVTKLD